MSDTDKKMIEHVHALISKAVDQHDGGDAMRYTQAANNAANALAVLQETALRARANVNPGDKSA